MLVFGSVKPLQMRGLMNQEPTLSTMPMDVQNFLVNLDAGGVCWCIWAWPMGLKCHLQVKPCCPQRLKDVSAATV